MGPTYVVYRSRADQVEWTNTHKVLPFARTWRDGEGITLSEVNQRKRYHMISLYAQSRKQTQNRRNWCWVGGWMDGWGKEIKGIKKYKLPVRK